tara:strand:+ start:754 stop:1602 length:849 start_codon:yes stop_codon:yes gene_type:complete
MGDWMEKLERLGALRDRELITEEEFEAERDKLLPTSVPPFSEEKETTYSPRQASSEQPPPPGSSNQTFREKHDRKETPKAAKWDLRGLSSGLAVFLVLVTIMHVWRIVAHAQRWSLINDLFDGRYVSYTQADAADSNVLNSFLGLIICHIVFLILMIVWAWRAADNLEHWNKKPQWGKGWAIGGWFTPIGFLFIPYQVVRDTWRLASKSKTGINYWWLVSFISWWIGVIAFRAAFADQESLEAMQNADIVAIVGICIQIFSALTMIKAISEISDRHAKVTLT